MALNSSAVSSGDLATASQYNNLRNDVVSTSSGHVHDGTLGVGSAQFILAVAGTPLILENTTNATSNQVGLIRGDNSTRADNDEIYVSFSLDDSAGSSAEFARMTVVAADVTTDSKDGALQIDLQVNDTLTQEYAFTNASLDMNANHLDNTGYVILNAVTLPASSEAYIGNDSAGDVTINALSGKAFRVAVAGTDEYAFGAASVDLNDNHLDNSGYLILNAVTNPGNSEVYISHDNTGDMTLNAKSAKTINLAINGTDEAAMSASAFNLTSGNTYQINGADVITGTALGTGMQADQAAIEGQTNENTYVPPDLMHHHPGVAKAWCFIAAAGTLSSPDYGVASVTDVGTGDRTVVFDTAFSSDVYSAVASNAHGSSNIARNVNVSLVAANCKIYVNDAESNAASDQNNTFIAFGDH